MRIGHVEVFVSDPRRARAFYEGVLGFEATDVQGDFTWLRSGGAGGPEVLLRPGRSAGRAPTYQSAPLAMVLYTDDLPRTRATLEARGLRFDGEDGGCPAFSDPDGNWFQLVDPRTHT
jgi:catechol 2,3-dioxygenase-like lactoylglutathione lyase family enzyme